MTRPRLADRIATRWSALSTGLKMFLILSLGLLPLGVIAVAASIENAQGNRARGEAAATAMLAVHVQRLTLPLARHTLTIRAARDAFVVAGVSAEGACARTLDRLNRLPGANEGRYALFGDGDGLRCISPGYNVPAIPAASGQIARISITPDGGWLRIFLYDPHGAPEGVVELPRGDLAELVNSPPLEGAFGVDLLQGTNVMPLRPGPPGSALADEIVVTHPLANGQYEVRVHAMVQPMTVSDVLIILTPLLMWLWASAIGWFLVQRLLLQPLKQIERSISGYRPGDAAPLPQVRSPAHEITSLGATFETMTRTVAGHEADLEAGLERQRRLVREVHHRVKNNLQVVASLLNIHSRGATDESATAAYAAIQRRVDALAVVHRNHYAELEENRGVALRPLVSELAANLRATAPVQAALMQIRLDVEPLHVNQDVAVSVAFLVTEITEFGMLCGATMVSIAVERGVPRAARLMIEMDGLADGPRCDQAVVDRFDRVISGLARQLRSPLEHEPGSGGYAIALPIMDEATEAPGAPDA